MKEPYGSVGLVYFRPAPDFFNLPRRPSAGASPAYFRCRLAAFRAER